MAQNSSTPAQHADKQQNRTKPYRNYKPTGVMGLFDEQEREARQLQQPKFLDRLSKAVDFEMFRPTLERYVLNPARKSPAGARRYNPVLMFKVLVLQQVYGYSDLKTEEMLDDCTSHRRFVGLASGDEIPDQKSIWLFRDTLTKSGAIEALFKQLDGFLHAQGLIINRGQTVDATFAEVPRQHNTPDENAVIKMGRGDLLWRNKPHKKRQKDVDARWTRKGGERFFGYKNHVKVDVGSKLVNRYVVTNAAVHDSQALGQLLEASDRGQELYADSAYSGKDQLTIIRERGMISRVLEKGAPARPLTEAQQASNRRKSQTRARVEHVFGFMNQSMSGLRLRCVGFERAAGIIGLINITYNLCRYEQIERLNLLTEYRAVNEEVTKK